VTYNQSFIYQPFPFKLSGVPNTKLVVLLFLEIVSNVQAVVNTMVFLSTYKLSPPNQSLKLTEPAVDDLARAK